METFRSRNAEVLRRLITVIAFTAGVCQASIATAAQGDKPSTDALRICAASNAKPYSNPDETGFENRLAKVIGEKLAMPVEFVWSDRPAIYLEMALMKPGDCDVIMGVDPDDQRMLTTKPYYRSGYVFITRADSPLNIESWASDDLVKAKTILVVPGSPPENALRKLNRFDDNINYIYSLVNFKDRRNQYTQFDPERLVNEVAQGNADVAILWGPEAARYVKASKVPLKMVMTDPTAAGQAAPVQFHYDQCIGVSNRRPELVDLINTAIDKGRSEIEALLGEEGIPLLNPQDRPVATPDGGGNSNNGEKG